MKVQEILDLIEGKNYAGNEIEKIEEQLTADPNAEKYLERLNQFKNKNKNG
jgi:hypothetical protein